MNRSIVLAFFLLVIIGPANGQNALELIRPIAVMSPAEFHRASEAADAFYQKGDHVNAADSYKKLTDAYPLNGEYWRRLGMSLYRAGRFAEAIAPLEKAESSGIMIAPQYTAVYIAECYARTGNKEKALDSLQTALTKYRFNQKPSLLNNKSFETLKTDPRFRQLAGLLPDRKFTRTEGWSYDIDYLLSEIRRLNAVYSKAELPADLLRAADELKKRIPKLTNEQMMFEMQHLLVMLHQAHNTIFLPGPMVKLTQLPLSFYAFPEGLYIINAAAPYQNLIGAKVLKFDDSTTEQVFKAVPYIIHRENDMAIVDVGADRIRIPQALFALKLTKDPTRVALTVEDREGKTIVVTPDPIARGSREKLLPPGLAGAPPPPLYLTRTEENYWYEFLPKQSLLFVEYNQVEDNEKGETLEQFGLRLRKFIDENDPKAMVIDVRRNNGGSTFVDAELLRTIVGFDSKPGHQLFVFTGRYTFSAASNFITDVDRLTNAVFVGEPSSSPPLMIGGDESPITLPYSGVGGVLSCTSWALTEPRDGRPWIAPDIPVQLTAKAYFENRDPLLETVLDIVDK